MKNSIPEGTKPDQQTEKFRKVIESAFYSPGLIRPVIYQDTEKDLNAKILQVTLMIRQQFPELSNFLDEMPVTIPNEEHPDTTLQSLKKYYDSLQAILSKYKLEHPYRKS